MSRLKHVALAMLFFGFASAVFADAPTGLEPNYRVASGWWSEISKKWTPVGWKNHLFRFNVFYNGAIAAESATSRTRRTIPWASQGALFWPSSAQFGDYGTVPQGWSDDHDAPVLWTDWSVAVPGDQKTAPVVLRQEVFAHVPGAQDVKTGVEPLFAWVRLSVRDPGQAATLAKKCPFSYGIYTSKVGFSMVGSKNLRFERKPYPCPLFFEAPTGGKPYGMLVEGNETVRLAVVSQSGCKTSYGPSRGIPELSCQFDVKPGSRVDLLIPMIPAPQDVIDRECSLGYEKALAEADRYWREVPATAATFDVPEREITRAVKRYLQMAEIIAEKYPATGDYCALTGSWWYADVWSTPSSMLTALMLDPMGYLDASERYLAVFRKNQGTTPPPGKAYKLHPGFLGTPKAYQAHDWLSDNGALLWAFSEHALIAGDEKFIEEYLPAIIKSCEWIRDVRRITGHGGIEGLLPPGIATDNPERVQSVWNDGWNYKGLVTAVRLLKRIKHPRAAEFEAEAKDYREKFHTAFRETAKKTPTWADAAGKSHPLVPRNLSGDKTWGINHCFYLDCGPLFLVFAGLMDAEDDLIASNRMWFREGPPCKTYRDDANPFQVPSLHHEISSCEPGYSWVFFHSWQQGDRTRFLEGMYSLFAGASSQQTYSQCETRGGIAALTPAQPGVYLARLAAVDDQIRENELHLLRLIPLAWLNTKQEARFERLPTEFGPVTVRTRLAQDGKELQVTFSADFRLVPTRIVLHIPPVQGLKAVTLNGRHLAWDGVKDTVPISR